MRYVGSLVLGMVFWAGQASAGVVEGKEPFNVLSKGTIIHSFQNTKAAITHVVLHGGQYWLCLGNLTYELGRKTGSTLTCFSQVEK